MKASYKADTDRVYSLLTDKKYLLERSIGLGDLEVQCDIEEQGDVTEIALTRKLVRDFPLLLAKLLNPEQTLKVREEWRRDEESEGSWVGSQVIEVKNQPITIFADFRLDPTGEGCCYTIKHKVKSRIPLLGSRISKYVLAQVEQGCQRQMDYLGNHL